jgi:hypothetical protein
MVRILLLLSSVIWIQCDLDLNKCRSKEWSTFKECVADPMPGYECLGINKT